MSDHATALKTKPPPAADSDYDAIHAAMAATERGRQFLADYVRRNREAETSTLLAAIGRIEALLIRQEEEAAAPPSVAEAMPQTGDVDVAPPDLPQVRDRIRDIADSLIECGAPSFLTNDLKRRVEELSRICGHLAERSTVLAARNSDRVEPTRDPFADIRALSDFEKIALFT